MVTYQYKTCRDIGRAMQVNPAASLSVGLILTLPLFKVAQYLFFKDATPNPLVAWAALIIGAVVIGFSVGFYVHGIVYQRMIHRKYGPTTLAKLVEWAQTNDDSYFDLEQVAKTNLEA